MIGLDLLIFTAFVVGAGLAGAEDPTWGIAAFVVAVVLAAIRGAATPPGDQPPSAPS